MAVLEYETAALKQTEDEIKVDDNMGQTELLL
jgi:hypothetical protein